MAALLASALAGALVAAYWFGGFYALAGGVALVQVMLAVGLTLGSRAPAARASAALALAAGLASGGYVVARADGSFDPDALAPVLVAVGAGFVGMVIVQLARRDGRDDLTASLTFGVTALLLITASVGWLVLGDDSVADAVVLVALTGVAVGAAIMIFPGPALLWVVGGTIAAASVGLILQTYVEPIDAADLGPVTAGVIAGSCGLASSVAVWAARLVHADDRPGAPTSSATAGHLLTVAALPVALAAPAAVVAAWALAEGLLT